MKFLVSQTQICSFSFIMKLGLFLAALVILNLSRMLTLNYLMVYFWNLLSSRYQHLILNMDYGEPIKFYSFFKSQIVS